MARPSARTKRHFAARPGWFGTRGSASQARSRNRLRIEALEPRLLLAALFPGPAHPVGYGPAALAVGDLNGDGSTDAVVLNDKSYYVAEPAIAVLIGGGDGTFELAQHCAVGDVRFSSPYTLALRDLDADGALDIVVANSQDNDLSVLMGRGDGTFTDQQRFPTGAWPNALDFGDLNGDGALDIVTANLGSDDVSVLMGRGDGTFLETVSMPGAGNCAWVGLGDLDSDGTLDMVVGNGRTGGESHGSVSAFHGNGDGSFASPQQVSSWDYDNAIALSDVDGNGTLDIIAGTDYSGWCGVWLGAGDGTFANGGGAYVGGNPITLADVNSDGDLDVVRIWTYYDGRVGVHLGLGGGSFAGSQEQAGYSHFLVGEGACAVAVADVDEDGALDLIVANTQADDISVVRGLGDGTFVSPLTFGGVTYAEWAGAEDMDGDGVLDIVTLGCEHCGQWCEHAFGHLLRGLGDGTFGEAEDIDLGSSYAPFAFGDLNSDSIPDVVTGTAIVLGEGNGAFAPPAPLDAGWGVALGDLNGDGALDVVTTLRSTGGVSTFLGLGDGTVQQGPSLTAGSAPYAAALGDMDGDGNLDLAVVNEESDSLSLFLGYGDGSFHALGPLGVGDRPHAVALADLDDDGSLDMAVANVSDKSVSLFLGNGDGSFAAQQPLEVGKGPEAVAIGDVDADGALDIVVCNDGNLSVFLGRGDGTFGPEQRFHVSVFSDSVALADLDRDGALDVVTAGRMSMSVVVLLNQLPSVWHEPSGFGEPPIDGVQFRFATARDMSSFSLEEDVLSFAGPQGPIQITGYDWVDEKTLRLSFPPQAAAGTYDLVVGPGILDEMGIALDIDGDRTPGEPEDDQYLGTFMIAAPEIVGHAPTGATHSPLGSLTVHFDLNMDTTSFSLAEDVVSFTGPHGAVPVTGFSWVDDRTLEISFEPQGPAGLYELIIGPNILDTAGNPLDQDRDVVAGETPDDLYTATFTIEAPHVLGHTPVGSTQAPVDSLTVHFDVGMDTASFSVTEDVVSFSGPRGPIPVTGFSWVDEQTLEVSFEPQGPAGPYELVLGPDILDTAGNPLDQDRDLIGSEALDDRYVATLTIMAPRVLSHTPTIVSVPPLSALSINFSTAMDHASFVPGDDIASLAGPDGPIAPTGFAWRDGDTLDITFAPQWTIGTYEMVLGPAILDAAGNALDQDADLTPGEDPDDCYTATFTLAHSGALARDTTWTPEGGVIVVDGVLTVPVDTTLTIEAGTIVKFSGSGSGIVVNGSLAINGTTDDPVILTSWHDDTAGGDTNGDGDASSPSWDSWPGVRFNQDSTGILENVEIRYAYKAIDADARYTNVQLRNAVLRDGGFGVYVYQPYAEVEAENCLIANNAKTGVFVRADSRHVLRNCTIVGNGFQGGASPWHRAGIHLGGATLTLENCIVAFNCIGLDHSNFPDPPLVTVRNCDFHNPDGVDIAWEEWGVSPPDLGADGNTTADPLFVDRTAGNYELAEGSPAIDAGRGTRAPATDILGRPRYDDPGMPNAGSTLMPYVDMGAFERQTATLSPDLAITNVQEPTPAALSAGATVSIEYTAANLGSFEASGSWQDILYLSDDPYLGSDVELARVDRTGPLAPGASYTETVDATVPATSGPKYILVRTNAGRTVPEPSEANNVGIAPKAVAIDVPELAIGTPAGGTVLRLGLDHYRFEAQQGQPVLFWLDGDAGTLGLYVREGLPPTLSAYDVAGRLASQPDQEVRLLNPEATTYYVSVYGQHVPGGATGYTLSATSPELTIRGVSPSTLGSGGTASIQIVGDGFTPDAEVQLVGPGGATLQGEEAFQDGSTLFATFDLAGAAAGDYEVVVTLPGPESATWDDTVAIGPGAPSQLEVDLVTPTISRPGRTVHVRIDYENTGSTDIAAPLFTLVADQEVSWLVPGATEGVESQTCTVIGAGSGALAHIVRPGESESLSVPLRMPFSPVDVNVAVYTVEAPASWGALGATLDWPALEADLRPVDVVPADWPAIWTEFQARAGDTWGDFLPVLAENANLLTLPAGCCRCILDIAGLEVMEATAAVSTSLRGTLVAEEDGLDVAGLLVTAWNSESGDVFTTYSVRDGSFIFEEVSAGTYELGVDGLLATSGQPIVVADGQALEGVMLSVAAGSSLTGTIRAGGTGLRLPNVLVTATNEDGDVYLALSDEQGQYALGGLPTGTYDLLVEAEGRAPSHLDKVVLAGKTAERHFLPDLGATVRGTLEVGSEVPGEDGVWVAARPAGEPDAEAIPGDFDGLGFTIRDLPAGTYDVFLSADGYLPMTLTDLVAGTAGALDVGAVSLTPAATISGVVTSHVPEAPASSAVIGVFDGGVQVGGGVVEDDGSFLIEGLPAGTYTVRAMHPDGYPSAEARLAIGQGQAMADVSVELLPGASVVGTVRDGGSGQPLGGIPVKLIGPDGCAQAVFSDASGEYRFERVGVGTHVVAVPMTGADASQVVEVANANGEQLSVDFACEYVAQLGGHVRTASGEPVADVTVRLTEDGRFVISAITDASGRYDFLVARGGTYGLEASADGSSYGAVAGVTVNHGDVVTQDIYAGSGSVNVSVTGLTDPDAITSIVLLRRVETGRLLAGTADLEPPAGVSFENLVAGEYDIQVVSGTERSGWASCVVTSGDAASVTVDLAPSIEVAGRVLGPDGSPVAGARVMLMSATREDGSRLATTDRTGAYEIRHVRPGEYDLVVLLEGCEAGIVAAVDVDSSTTLNVSLSASSGELNGRIVDHLSEGVAGGWITVLDAEGRIIGQAATGGNGGFSISTASGANLCIVVEVPGAVVAPIEEVTIAAGAPTNLGDLAVEPLAVSQHAGALSAGFSGEIIGQLRSEVGSTGRGSDDDGIAPLPSPGQFGEGLWNWLDSFVLDMDRAENEVSLADLNPLPSECRGECQFYRDAVVEMIDMQDWAYDKVKDIERHMLRMAGFAVSQGLLDLDAAIARLFQAYYHVQSIRNYRGVESAQRLFQGATKGARAGRRVLGFQDSLDGMVRNAFEAREAEEAGDALGVLEELAGTANDMWKALFNLADIGAIIDGDEAASRFFGPFLAYQGLLSDILGLGETLDYALMKDARDTIGMLLAARVQYEGWVREYHRRVAFANTMRDAYHACLQGCEGEDPDDESPIGNRTSFTPEDKFGPSGHDAPGTPVGAEVRFVADDDWLEYRVEFWNREDAPVPTQDAVIQDVLDPAVFDLTTLELTDFGFLQWDVPLSAGTQAIDTRVDLRPDMNLAVDVTADVDPDTGQIEWWFHCVDPMTGDYPEDPMAGFLPPYNPDTGYEVGWVEFRVKPLPGLPTGTQALNQAYVEFDFAGDMQDHPAPMEAPWLNTIDAGAPESSVAALPAETTVPEFLVEWAGTDDAGGSGIASYDIYVATDGGACELWLDDTAETSATFDGKPGHTYAFSSIATDNVGNTEPVPAGADATTTLPAFAQVLTPGRKTRKWSYIDADGDRVTVALGGKEGTAEIVRAVPDGQPGDAVEITVTGTDARSSLKITSKGQTTVWDIIVQGSLKQLVAKTTTLLGDLTVDDWLGKAILGDIADQHVITLGGTEADKPITFIAGHIQDLAFTSGAPVKAFTALDWLDTDATPDTFTAPSLAKLTTKGRKANAKKGIAAIAGDFEASLDLDGPLGKAKIAASVTKGTWTIGGAVGSIVTGLDFCADLDALSVKSMSVKGNLDGATIDLTQGVDPKLKALSKLIVTGWTRDTAVTTAGHVAKFQTGGMDGSCLLLGVTGMELPDEATDFAGEALLKSFTVKGIKDGKVYEDSFIDSDVAAWSITKASIREVVTDNAGDPFGFAWCELKSLKWTEGRDKFKCPEKKPTDWPDDTVDFTVVEVV